MGIRLARFLAAALLVMVLVGCPPVEDPGGLKASDFRQININGFDSEDNARDKNDYAWAMEYFQPNSKDPAPAGYVYVATGNNMVGLMIGGMMAMMGGGSLDDVPVYPPEIRRYRPDIFPLAWERVLDYRDIETDELKTIGFRFMKAYQAHTDGINYLYAATFGRVATLLRSATGDPGSWEAVWDSGDVGSVRWMEPHDGILYFGLANDAPEGEKIGKIWATDGDVFWPVIEDGFGNPKNTGIMSLVSYSGWLYAGTQNQEQGFEIWKLEGPGGAGPVQVVTRGGNDSKNESAITPCIFQGKLYYGTMIYHMASIMGGFKGCEIIRINEDDSWETIVGPNGLSGYRSGFNHWPNTYQWWMTVHDGWLYASTFDQVSSLTSLPEHIPAILQSVLGNLKRDPRFLDVVGKAGADLYKTQDGIKWYPVTLGGFGDVGNYGFRTLLSVGDDLYVGTANPFDGLEVWKATSPTD